jgi:hypothetical protein
MRCFVVGNGPSLTKTNLDLLVGQPSFACNDIHLIYPYTTWRPTFYVRSERFAEGVKEDVWLPSVEETLKAGAECHLSGYYQNHVPKLKGVVTELKHCTHHTKNFDDIDCPTEWHLPWLCQFGGSLIVAMQIALLKGFTEIVLVGCDLNYRDGKPSHFDNDYEHGMEQPAFYANKNNLWAHMCGINYHARRNLPYNVINATVGGDLHLYPRKKLEDV